MKKLLAVLIIALLLATVSYAESNDGYNFFFDDEGYTGEWVSVDMLDFDFCLPDGWAQIETEAGAVYSAVSGDAAATLDIRVEAENVEDIADWASKHLRDYVLDEAGMYDAIVLEPDENHIGVGILLGSGQLVHYRFARANEEDVPREYALQIAGSTSEKWLAEAYGNMDDSQNSEIGDVSGDEDFFADLESAFAAEEDWEN